MTNFTANDNTINMALELAAWVKNHCEEIEEECTIEKKIGSRITYETETLHGFELHCENDYFEGDSSLEDCSFEIAMNEDGVFTFADHLYYSNGNREISYDMYWENSEKYDELGFEEESEVIYSLRHYTLKDGYFFYDENEIFDWAYNYILEIFETLDKYNNQDYAEYEEDYEEDEAA